MAKKSQAFRQLRNESMNVSRFKLKAIVFQGLLQQRYVWEKGAATFDG